MSFNANLITLAVAGILSIVVSVVITHLFLKKIKTYSEAEGKVKLSYILLMLSWIIAFSIINEKSISILKESLDIIYVAEREHLLSKSLEVGVLFIGLSNIWLVFVYYLANLFTRFFYSNRRMEQEMQNDNYSYFLMKGVLFIGSIYLLLPVFESYIRFFQPNLEIPFYR